MFAVLYRIRKSAWAGYLFPLPAALLALAMHQGMERVGATGAPFLPFLLALVLSAVLGGVGPALLCTGIVGILANHFMLPGGMSTRHGNEITLALLSATAIIILCLVELGMRATLKLKQTSEETRRANETLEARVAERSAELMQAEEKLRQAQKMEAVGQLSGGIAHDFNNLLTGIMGSLERLQTRLPYDHPDELARYIATAQDAATRASNLTHRLLAFSRRQPLTPSGVDINQLVAGMAELISRTIGPFIKLEIATEAGPHATLVDPNQLEHALLNLCINAADAMPAGGSLRITTANKSLTAAQAGAFTLPAGDYVTMSVTDTGIGMTEDVLARACDPFFTTKPLGQGTGLGLSMTYGFARQSGGHVAIASTPSLGTNVTLYLPVHLAGEEASEQAAGVTTQPAITATGGETILLVDDEPSIRLLAAEVLEEQGYTVHQAAEGGSAMQILSSGVPLHLLITDLGLPGIQGRELANSGINLHPGLKVLFITGYMENAAPRTDPVTPSMRLLTKPFALSSLPVLVREMLDQERVPTLSRTT